MIDRAFDFRPRERCHMKEADELPRNVKMGNLSGFVGPEQNDWQIGNLSLHANVFISTPTHLVLRDETGQEWAVSVRPDGQLQIEKRLGESESLGID